MRAASCRTTGTGPGVAPPKWLPAASPGAGRVAASRPAARSAAAASTSPKPVAGLYRPAGRCCAEPTSACSTWAGDSRGYAARISAATPATKAAAGLVPVACR